MLAKKLEVVRSNGPKNQTYNAVKRFAVEGLSDLIRVLMENVDDALFELSDKVDNDQERNQYFVAMREVRLKRDAIKREFDHEMQECFGRVSRGKSATKTSEVDEDDTELTLLEHDDLGRVPVSVAACARVCVVCETRVRSVCAREGVLAWGLRGGARRRA